MVKVVCGAKVLQVFDKTGKRLQRLQNTVANKVISGVKMARNTVCSSGEWMCTEGRN